MTSSGSQIEIVINGESQVIPDQWTVKDLLDQLVTHQGPVAVELNRQILKKADWHLHRLERSDRLEIVHFVGGG